MSPQEDDNGEEVHLDLHLKDLQGVVFQRRDNRIVHMGQAEQTLRFDIPSSRRLLPKTPLRYRTTSELKVIGDRPAMLEWARRMSLPFASSALLMVGIALGFGHARFHKGGALPRSLGVILVYYLVLKYIETMWLNGKLQHVYPILAIPFIFFILGLWILRGRLHPHRPALGAAFQARLSRAIRTRWEGLRLRLSKLIPGLTPHLPHKETRKNILNSWTRRLWVGGWGSALGSLLILNFLIEYATWAGDLARNHIPFEVFLRFWAWRLPPFLSVALPMSFLLGSMLAISEAVQSLEWTALRAGGLSFLQWAWKGKGAWMPVLAGTIVLQVWLAPLANPRADKLSQQILKRDARPAPASASWMDLGNTGVLWHLDPHERWGFPLKQPGEAPILLKWDFGASHSQALAWGGMAMVEGPPAELLFPSRELRRAATADDASTWDLLAWHR